MNDDPISSSHWTFWVTIPRLEVRLRNRASDSNGSCPARSFARTDRKNPMRTTTPLVINARVSQRLLLAARMPMTISTRPTADNTVPRMSNGRVGSAGRGSLIRPLSPRTAATISAWNTKAARQLIASLMRPPINGPAAAPTPPIAMIIPKAFARAVTSVNSSVVRM